MASQKLRILVAGSLSLLFPQAVFADQATSPQPALQNSSGPGTGNAPMLSEPYTPGAVAPYSDPLKTDKPLRAPAVRDGIEVDSFLLRPEVSLTEMYDDNIYATRTRESDDMITTIAPSILIQSNWAKHKLNIRTGVEQDIYQNHSSENVIDHWLEADGRYDLSDRTNIFGGAGISRNHEDRANLDNPERAFLTAAPTRYWEKKAHIGIFHQFDRAQIRFGSTYEHLDFNNVDSLTGGKILMDDRDRKLYSTGGRATIQLNSKYSLFVQAATDTRRYVENYVDRDSDGYRVALGAAFDFGGNNKAEFFLGRLKQNFDNAQYSDVSKPYFGAEANLAIGPSTYLLAYLDRTLSETTLTGASSDLETTVGARVDHDMNQDLSLNARLAYTRSSYQGITRDEDYVDAGFGAKYYMTRDLYIAADYRLMLRETDVNTPVVNGEQNPFDFSKNRIFFSIGYTPGRKPRPVMLSGNQIYLAANDLTGIQLPDLIGVADYSGFYVGAQTGLSALTAYNDSKRTEGTDEMDLGKVGGQTNGLFAGYGGMHGRWYYGIEVDAETGNAELFHSKAKADARTISIKKDSTYGIGLRGGYALPGGLLYGRLGLVRTDLEAYSTENQFNGGAYDDKDQVTGLRYGVGMEIPASNHVFVRMDYSYTRYEDVKGLSQANLAGTKFTSDKFDISDNLFRLGLGWRFGDEKPAISMVEAASVDGFFAGAKVGYGVLGSDMKATHNDSGGGPFAFTGDFGNGGTTLGFFGGYGITLHRVYLGLEGELEGANVEWKSDRTTEGGGREFSVSKKSSVGANLKVGYVLDNGTLLYAKVGRVETRFNTLYEKGNAKNWVDRDDELKGDRFGIGAEMPAYRNVFVKFDYTFTYYDKYGFTTQHANADTVSFEHKESLFNLGVGMRF